MHKVEFENVTLWHGDCRDVLPLLSGVDAVISDPPYGISYDSSHTKYKNGVERQECGWDVEPFDPAPILALDKPTVLWGGNCFASRLPDHSGWLSWVKIHRNGAKIRQSETEMAWTNCVNRSQAFRWNWIGAGMEGEGNAVYGGLVHPTQKPIVLMQWCFDVAKVATGAMVLDPYMGSGTTGIACIRTGRRFIGVEKDPVHFATACKRIEQELSQGQLAL